MSFVNYESCQPCRPYLLYRKTEKHTNQSFFSLQDDMLQILYKHIATYINVKCLQYQCVYYLVKNDPRRRTVNTVIFLPCIGFTVVLKRTCESSSVIVIVLYLICPRNSRPQLTDRCSYLTWHSMKQLRDCHSVWASHSRNAVLNYGHTANYETYSSMVCGSRGQIPCVWVFVRECRSIMMYETLIRMDLIFFKFFMFC